MGTQYASDNNAQLARLQALAARLSDADLNTSLGGGWIVGTALAHMAFWDGFQRLTLQRWQEGIVAPAEDPILNVALEPMLITLPPREALRLALEAAEAINQQIEALERQTIAAIVAHGDEFRLRRSNHRQEHIDQIEAGLAARS